ncbi:hypothetical protein M413DRAFT_33050, partial [Hebeloma cylindrosporum]
MSYTPHEPHSPSIAVPAHRTHPQPASRRTHHYTMPPKPKPRGKAQPPTDTRKRQASNAAEQPVKRARCGTNPNKERGNNDDEEHEEDDETRNEEDEDGDEEELGPWPDVEEKAIAKVKKGPPKGRKKMAVP